VGLLQLLPATARRAATVLGRPPPTDSDMANPANAIDMGAWYLSELLGRFANPAVAAAAYNAGPRIALPWAERGAGQPLDRWVEELPYRETRSYVKAVMGSWSAYRILAGGSPPRLPETVPAPGPGAAF
jgi:soluble lytic murein transglycosylase